MTSDRARRANTQNAQASTGPRTNKGKARSRQNARKHGLAAASSVDTAGKAEQLASHLVGHARSHRPVWEAALRLAEIQLHLQRVIAAKHALMRQWPLRDENSSPSEYAVQAAGLSTLLQGLERLERYERRTFSQRKTAGRHLQRLLAEAELSTKSDLPPPRLDNPGCTLDR